MNRLIINGSGESARAEQHGQGTIVLSVDFRTGDYTPLRRADGAEWTSAGIRLAPKEAAALALQLLNAAGYAAEIQVLPPAVRRDMAVDVQPLRRARKIGEVSL